MQYVLLQNLLSHIIFFVCSMMATKQINHFTNSCFTNFQARISIYRIMLVVIFVGDGCSNSDGDANADDDILNIMKSALEKMDFL